MRYTATASNAGYRKRGGTFARPGVDGADAVHWNHLGDDSESPASIIQADVARWP